VTTTTADLAADLGVDEGDVDVLLEQLDEREPELPDDLAGFLRESLDPHGECTAPAGLYWPGADPKPPRAFGLGGPNPTAPELDRVGCSAFITLAHTRMRSTAPPYVASDLAVPRLQDVVSDQERCYDSQYVK
jgi:hypothetical protein